MSNKSNSSNNAKASKALPPTEGGEVSDSQMSIFSNGSMDSNLSNILSSNITQKINATSFASTPIFHGTSDTDKDSGSTTVQGKNNDANNSPGWGHSNTVNDTNHDSNSNSIPIQPKFKRKDSISKGLSSSTIDAVNNAAQTAIVVLDEAVSEMKILADDASLGSKSSRGSRKSRGSRRSKKSRRSSGGSSGSGSLSRSSSPEHDIVLDNDMEDDKLLDKDLEEEREKHKKEWYEDKKLAGGRKVGAVLGLGAVNGVDSPWKDPQLEKIEVQKAVSSVTHTSNQLDSNESNDASSTSSSVKDTDGEGGGILEHSFTQNSDDGNVMTGMSPPPLAFQNLPMMRGFRPSSSTGSGHGDGVLGSGLGSSLKGASFSSGGTAVGSALGDDIAAEDLRRHSAPVEVTSHFEAAAAVSAALASSNLAQVVGLAKHPYLVKRRSSSKGQEEDEDDEGDKLGVDDEEESDDIDEEDDDDDRVRPRKLSSSIHSLSSSRNSLAGSFHGSIGESMDDIEDIGDALERLLSSNKETEKGECPLNETAASHSNRSSGAIVRKKLPSPEEAAAEVAARRSSFISDDGNDEVFHEARDALSVKSMDEDQLDAQCKNQNLQNDDNQKQKSSNETSNIASASDAKDGVPDEDVNAGMKTPGEQSVESISICSSSGYENESNTSSVYGSDISPITMSEGSREGQRTVGDGRGLLNTLNNLKAEQEDNSYDGGSDGEHSMQSVNMTAMAQFSNEKTPKINFGPMSTKALAPSTQKPVGVFDVEDGSNTTGTYETSNASDRKRNANNALHAPPSSSAKSNPSSDGQSRRAPRKSSTLLPVHHHHLSLFESFDRNWEQAVRNQKSLPDRELELGKQCLASFAVMFGSSSNESSSFGSGEQGGALAISTAAASPPKGVRSPHFFPFWSNDHALGTKPNEEDATFNRDEGKNNEKKNNSDMIPTAVIRTMWKTCIFELDANVDHNEVDQKIESILDTLINDLGYLSVVGSSSVPCIRLSLGIYAEYGWFLFRRHFGGSEGHCVEDQVKECHSKFASVLHQYLLSSNPTDSDLLIIRRYAAHSLPRHTAYGILGIDSNGYFQSEATEELRARLNSRVFENLFCNSSFVKLRAELIGRGYTRPAASDNMLNGHAHDQLVNFIKQSRDSDWNFHLPTQVHLKDIEWCASFCDFVGESVCDKGDHESLASCNDGDDGSSLSKCDCLDALTLWRRECIAQFRSLYDSGKLTVQDVSSNDSNESSQAGDKQTKSKALPRLYLSNNENGVDRMFSTEESAIEVAKSLLTRDDAWTIKDNTRNILHEDYSAESSTHRKPPRKSQKGQRNKVKVKSSALSRILALDINHLRTAVSIGRSLLSLSEFVNLIMDKVCASKSHGSTAFTTRLHHEQSFCLNDAIQIFSSVASTLLCILASSLDKLDEDDLDESVTTSLGPAFCLQRFTVARDEAKPLLALTGILSADAWFSLGSVINNNFVPRHKSKSSKSNARKQAMVSSYERSLLVLNSPRSIFSSRKPTDTCLHPLTSHRYFIQSSVNHSLGVNLYELGNFNTAASYLDEAARFKRQLLEDLNGQANQNQDQNAGLTTLMNSAIGAVKISSIFSTQSVESVPEDIVEDVTQYSVNHSISLLPQKRLEKSESDELELSLSLTLEYSALTQHASQLYQAALSLFQESLILRTMHVGKSSLDVASLHFNMGVVHDDLEQYEAAISRYYESLRIRLHHLDHNHSTSSRNVSELEDSVLLTLKCMGHVYKVINDIDNAVCCYVKALEMIQKRVDSHRESADEWTKMCFRLDLSLPVPTVIFDEMKNANNNDSSWKSHFQAINKKALCHHFGESERSEKRKSRSVSALSKLKKEMTKIHSTVIALIHQKKHSDKSNANTATRSMSRLPVVSNLFSSLSSSSGDTLETALMNSSFNLGVLRMEQGRHDEAADQLEVALRSKWVLDPASSSDSDSDLSSSYQHLTGRKHQSRPISEHEPEEGQIYYALGLANSSMDDHERAVRCFLTSLRYLRRTPRMVDSLEVARVLFDTAASYYFLCNFDQSISLWNDCLRILRSFDTSKDATAAKKSSYRQGVAIYCLVLAKCALELEYQPETIDLLNQARNLLAACRDKALLAYLDYLTGHFLHHTATQIPTRLRAQIPASVRLKPNEINPVFGLTWDEMCQNATSLFEQVKNECWFDLTAGIDEGNEVKNLPLSAHLCLKKGQIFELTGSIELALDSYMDAVNFYRAACGHENVYAASVLHRMGSLCGNDPGNEHHALGYFNEALSIRKNLLGGNDRRVADTLYCSAIVLARLNKYESSMERYHEALRIQMSVIGQGSNDVAMTLAGMGLCHYSHREYELALTCLTGALKVRKHRITRLSDGVEHSKKIVSKSDRSYFGRLDNIYVEEVSLGSIHFSLGNVQMQLGDYDEAMQHFIHARDIRWRHVGGGSTDKILDRYLFGARVDEDELLGLAHCLHNIGVLFDINKEYERSLPHYEEALAIKNALSGYGAGDSVASLISPGSVDSRGNDALVLQSLEDDAILPDVTKATLSAAMTRQKMASVYAKQKKYGLAIFHYSHALKIQRQVLGRDHFITSLLLTNMGNVLRRTSTHSSQTAIMCYNESLRISRLRYGPNHERVASALYNLGDLYDSKRNVDKAVHYYNRALSVYKQRYAQDLRRRLCSGLGRLTGRSEEGENSSALQLSTGDEIVLGDSPTSEAQIREQYMLVTKALRKATKKNSISSFDRNDWWLAFEVQLFRFVEMLSTYVIDPAHAVLRDSMNSTQRRIESAASHAIITAADAIDYQFQLLIQE